MNIRSSGRGRRPPTTVAIDTDEFARRAESLSGERPIAECDRLASIAFDREGALRWRLTGERRVRPDGGPESWLHLALTGTVGLACNRCLERVSVELAGGRDYLLVRDEQSAEKADQDSDDYDVLAHARRFDVEALVEDEAIMMLPVAPRHADCRIAGAPAEAGAEPDEPTPNPFAVLAALKSAKGD